LVDIKFNNIQWFLKPYRFGQLPPTRICGDNSILAYTFMPLTRTTFPYLNINFLQKNKKHVIAVTPKLSCPRALVTSAADCVYMKVCTSVCVHITAWKIETNWRWKLRL